jgi:long-subunit acyl-CoA synthetase (AMP-forming)
VFAGYHLDEAGTREVLDDDGWLRTGDLGSLHADGFLTVTDRKKDIIVTSEDENVSPQRVETALRASRYVAEAIVVGHGRPYLVALLVPALNDVHPVARTDAEVRRLLSSRCTPDARPTRPPSGMGAASGADEDPVARWPGEEPADGS